MEEPFKLLLIIAIFIIIMSFIKSFREDKEGFGGVLTQLYASSLNNYYPYNGLYDGIYNGTYNGSYDRRYNGLYNKWQSPFGIWNIPTRTQNWMNYYNVPYWEYPWRYLYR